MISMPPVRTPATRGTASRTSKCERTHEENVERAFIAASRRCDRTLEARVESARRASEIHKARTGRGLKITEQDVQNEEMYEEEDDDLPLQYRHLTAGFQTSSPEFNRRFAAYLTTHVAIRTALEQSIIQSYQQQAQQQQQHGLGTQYQFQNQQFERFPSPFLAHQAQQSQIMISPTHGSPVSRYSPYPIPPRSNIAPPLPQNQLPKSISNVIPQINNEKRISETSSEVPPLVSQPSTPLQSSNDENLTLTPLTAPSFASCNIQQPSELQTTESSQSHLDITNQLDICNFGPLSTALPPETQSLLGHNLGLGGSTCEMYDNINNNIELNYFDSQIKSETKRGLNSTLISDVNILDSPYTFTNSNYFDEVQPAKSVSVTPGSAANDENDWRSFIDRSDSWPNSE